jgi:hypothetical protein
VAALPSIPFASFLFCLLPLAHSLVPEKEKAVATGRRPAGRTLPLKGILSFRRLRMHRPCSSSPCLLWMRTGIEWNGRGRRRRTLPAARGQPVRSLFL